MKRRAKLNLAPAGDADKGQAPDFETVDTTRPETKPNETQMHFQAAEPQDGGPTSGEGVTQKRTWPAPARVAKVLLVVAASALSLYLLKRRFF